MTQSKLYTGKDLLDKIFEFKAMTPNSMEWNLNALKSNPPRYIRLQQIESLIGAFFEQKNTSLLDKAKALFTDKKNISLQSILNGDFIKERTIVDYTETITFMKNIVKEKEGEIDENKEIHLAHLIMPYQQLIKYKQQLIDLLSFNAGWLEASSISARFSIYLTNSISVNLLDKFTNLDKALELFINPKGLSFTEDELKAAYKFPLDNLNDVDLDFM